MIGVQDLSQKSIRQTLEQMMKRGVIAAPFHIALFLFMILWVKELRPNPVSWIFFSMIVVAGLVRVCQLVWGKRLLFDSNSVRIWRAIFCTHTWALGIAWGINCGYSVYTLGLTSSAITVFALTSCIAAASVPAFSFDLLIQCIFQSFMFIPTMLAAWSIDDPNGVALGVGFLFFLVFMWYAGASLFRFQIGVLRASELVEKQKLDLQVSHEKLSTAHETIETMLESIDEAFLNFDSAGRCSTTASKKSRAILGMDPSGLLIEEILTETPEEQIKIKRWFAFLFLQPDHFESLSELGLRSIIRRTDSHTLRLTFHAVRETSGNLKTVVLTAIDVQREMEARKLATYAAQRAELILRINENRTGFQALLIRIEDSFTEMKNGRIPIANVRQELHTIKGALAVFGAVDISRRVFDCELELKGESVAATDSDALASLQRLHTAFEVWKKGNTALFAQLGLYGDEVVELSKRKMQSVQAEFNDSPEQFTIAKRILSRLVSVDFGDILEDFRPHLESTAAKLGKRIKFEIGRPSAPIFVNSKSREMLRSFVHLFNNALDHGIETPGERAQACKSPEGTIKIEYEKIRSNQRNWIRLVVSDDGAGINVSRIRQKREISLHPLPKEMSEIEIAELILEDSFTTRQNVTEISGQGVGMGAVRAAIQKYGGRVKILATSNLGLSLEVLLPDEA